MGRARRPKPRPLQVRCSVDTRRMWTETLVLHRALMRIDGREQRGEADRARRAALRTYRELLGKRLRERGTSTSDVLAGAGVRPGVSEFTKPARPDRVRDY